METAATLPNVLARVDHALRRLRAITLVAAMAAGWAQYSTAVSLVARPVATNVYEVTAYGAVGDGVTDSSAGARAAMAAASATGGMVHFAAGHYVFKTAYKKPAASMQVRGTLPITIAGDGASSTVLTQQVSGQGLLSVQVDGTVVQGLTLDTQTGNGGVAIGVQANNTTLQNAAVLGPSSTFALYYIGPGGATPDNGLVNTGNKVLNTAVNDLFPNDGFSFSYQSGGLIQNIDHTGSRLALYRVQDTTVDGYRYTPGPQPGGTNGFYITPPSRNITITNFVSTGQGGIIGQGSIATRFSSNITIRDEHVQMLGGFHLTIGDVDGLTLSGCRFGADDWISVKPNYAAKNVVVENCTVPAIRFTPAAAASITNLQFNSCTFPRYQPTTKGALQTFFHTGDGPTDFVVNGGTWLNRSGGFFKGSNTTYQVYNLAGYP